MTLAQNFMSIPPMEVIKMGQDQKRGSRKCPGHLSCPYGLGENTPQAPLWGEVTS